MIQSRLDLEARSDLDKTDLVDLTQLQSCFCVIKEHILCKSEDE